MIPVAIREEGFPLSCLSQLAQRRWLIDGSFYGLPKPLKSSQRNPYARSETGRRNALPVKESYTSGIDRGATTRRGAAQRGATQREKSPRATRERSGASARVRHARVCAPAAPHTWTAAYVAEYRNGDSARRETSLPTLAGLCSPDRAAIKTFAQIA